MADSQKYILLTVPPTLNADKVWPVLARALSAEFDADALQGFRIDRPHMYEEAGDPGHEHEEMGG